MSHHSKKINEEDDLIDFSEERNRRCHECKRPFKAHNLLMDFCSRKCKDNHHNRRKRFEAIARKQQEEEKLMFSMSIDRQENIRWNVGQLESLVHPGEIKEFHLDIIDQLNINLESYDGRYPLEHSKDLYYLTMGPFHLCLGKSDTIIIENTKP